MSILVSRWLQIIEQRYSRNHFSSLEQMKLLDLFRTGAYFICLLCFNKLFFNSNFFNLAYFCLNAKKKMNNYKAI